jgi:hypothetical protein
MRILAILALALLLASCQGNRLNVRQAQPTERSAVG